MKIQVIIQEQTEEIKNFLKQNKILKDVMII
jgi:hypothetical protein